jgi:hypothetical protein
VAPVRPASVPAPTEDRPIALWVEVTQPLVGWKGDLRIAYEKLPGWAAEGPLAWQLTVAPAHGGKGVSYTEPAVNAPAASGWLDLSKGVAWMWEAKATEGMDTGAGLILFVTVGRGSKGVCSGSGTRRRATASTSR